MIQNGCKHKANAEYSFIFTCTAKGWWGFCGFCFPGQTLPQGIPMSGEGKASVVTEWKVANCEGWNVASRFGFEYWIVGWESQRGAK
ncbi:MAG: hypothetical protein C0397_18015 [Odoribacter sp.]|nr:hypothetical protein [Odoribacter sp.]